MLNYFRIFRQAILTVVSDYVLDILQEAGVKEDTDKHLSSLYLYNAVNKYILVTFKTLGDILRDLEREQKIKRKVYETEGTTKPFKETLWAFNA